MSALGQIARAVLGLVVDDEFLALGILAAVAVVAFGVLVLGAAPLLAGAILLASTVLVLVLGVLRTASRRQP